MTFVCLWSPAWPTGAGSAADIAPDLLEWSPRVAVDAGGLLWCDARSLDAMAIGRAALRALERRGVTSARAGVAGTPIAASMAARHGQDPVTAVPAGTDRMYLAPFPIAFLAPAPPVDGYLSDIGIETCGDLARLDRESVEVRFGPEGVALWRLARADDARLLFPPASLPLPQASLDWIDYVLTDPERLQFVINALLGNVCSELAARGEKATALQLSFQHPVRTAMPVRAGQVTSRKSQVTSVRSPATCDLRLETVVPLRVARPTASRTAWMRLIRTALFEHRSLATSDSRLAPRDSHLTTSDQRPATSPRLSPRTSRLTLPDAVTGIALAVTGVALPLDQQGDLFDRGFATAIATEEAVAQVADSGNASVVLPRRSQHPLVERRIGWDAEEPAAACTRMPPGAGGQADGTTRTPGLRLQLLPEPQRVDVATAPRRDHEIPARYRDRAGWHAVMQAAGPDRITGGQWETPYARDYYRCVTDEGRLVWMFRERERWYVQGWWD